MSHYVYIKDFDRLMSSITKNQNKKWFCRRCLQCFSSKCILMGHREDCLLINRKQSVKLGEGFISFKNYSRQIPAPFKIYADFECILKKSREYEDDYVDKSSSYTKKYQDHVPCGFGYNVFCVDNRFSKKVVVYRGRDCVSKFISVILDEYEYCKSVMKKHFNKNLIMSVEEEKMFQLSNKCWICDKLFDFIDEKVQDHCHITGKFRRDTA